MFYLLILFIIFITILNCIRLTEKLDMNTISALNTDGSCNQSQTMINLLSQYNILDSKLTQYNTNLNNVKQNVNQLDTKLGQMDVVINKNQNDIKQINTILSEIGKSAEEETFF